MTKDFILSEIRRTATENGGQPVGRMRFLKLTGIKETDWLGRYWVKWGDALVEAGLTPNSLQRAYEAEQILAPLMLFVAEIGKFPTHAELRMKTRSEPGFPSHNTFAKFGNKAALAGALLKYSEDEGHSVVAEICKDVISSKSEEEPTTESLFSDSLEYGEVYLIKFGKFYKIGRSNNAGRRYYELSIQLPEKARIVHKIRTDDPSGIEAYWHHRFKAKRRNGEWFELNLEDVSAFRRRRFM